jgi:hypothetical protein
MNRFGKPYRSSASLTKADIPLKASRWHEVVEFAATFQVVEHSAFQGMSIPLDDLDAGSSIDSIRFTLYTEWRRWNHFGYIPTSDVLPMIQKALDLLREKLPH